MGFECAPRQTTADFLTSLTNPAERLVRPEYQGKTPKSREDFVQAWKSSQQYAKLHEGIEIYNQKYPLGGESAQEFINSKRAQQAPQQYVNIFSVLSFSCSDTYLYRRITSPFTLSLNQQVKICVDRGFLRLKGDASVTISRVVANIIMALIVGMLILFSDPGATG